MTTRSRLTCVGAFALAALVAGVATGQPIDKRTTFTFSGPVAVPGVTLPAGSYVFHFTDVNHRSVLQVLSADGRTAYGQFNTLETWRERVAQDPEVRFMETAADMPHAIRSVWAPGDSLGWELMYSREQAQLLANGLGTPVLAEPLTAAAPPEYIAPEEVAIAPEPIVEEAAVEPAPVAVAEAPAAPAELPKTDSPTATMLFVGLGALLIGVFVHTIRTTMA